MNADIRKAIHDKLVAKLVHEGRVIEAGWQIHRAMILPPVLSGGAIEDHRLSFFAGAQHVFASVLAVMDEDRDPTQGDLDNMTRIYTEIESIREVLMAKAKANGWRE